MIKKLKENASIFGLIFTIASAVFIIGLSLPFFTEARKQLKRKLKLYTRIAMKVVDEGGRRGFLTHLCC